MAAPDEVVVVDPTGAHWTRGDVDTLLRRFGGWLQTQAPGPVSIRAGAHPEAAIFAAAASWSGRPALVMPEALPAALVAAMDAQVGPVVRMDAEVFGSDAFAEALDTVTPLAHWPAVDPEQTAMILLSSGTTRQPRGVRLSHRALLAALPLSSVAQAGLRIAIATGPQTVTGARFGFLYPALLGGRAVWLDPQLPPLELVREAGRQGAEVLAIGPAFVFTALAAPERFAAAFARGGVRVCFGGGGPLTAEVRAAFARQTGASLAWSYGLTETTGGFVTAWARPGTEAEPGVGRRVAGIQVVDEHGGALPVGAEGEVVLTHDVVFSGYTDGPEVPRGTPLHTGDLGHIDPDGVLHLAGRRDRRFLDPTGDKVMLDEVEATIAALTGRRAYAGAVGSPTPWLAALIEGADVEEGSVRAVLAAHLPPAAVPRRIVAVAEIPTGRSGKVELAGAHALLRRAIEAQDRPTPS